MASMATHHPTRKLARSRVDLEVIDQPVSLRESRRIILHISLASRRLRRASRITAPHLPSPLPTESGIEQDTHILEMLVDIAAPCEGRDRHTPCGRVRLSRGDILGDVTAGERPDLDACAEDFGRDDSTAGLVEGCAVGGCGRVLDLASRVLLLGWVTDVAIRCF